MKKLYLYLFLILSLLSLASCHGVKALPDFKVPINFDESKDYNLEFWAKNDSNIYQKEIYQEAIKDFEALYPNIHINIIDYNDYGKIYEDVLNNIPTNTTPNICIAYPDHVATYNERPGLVVPLDSLMNDPFYGLGAKTLKFDAPTKNEITKKFLDEGYFDGNYYTLPFMRSTEAMYLNKTYLEENGFLIKDIYTWDEIWEICDYARKKADKEGEETGKSVRMLPMIYKSTDNMFIQMIYQNKLPYANSNGEVFILNDKTKDLLFDLAYHTKEKHFETFKRVSYPGNAFNKIQCVVAIDSTAGATWMGPDAPNSDINPDEIKEFEPIVRPIPQVDINNPMMISQGPSICLFNKEDPQEVLASWIFMQFLLTNKVQIAYSQTEGYVPVTIKAINDPRFKAYLEDENEYKVKRDATKLIIKYTENTFITPVFDGSANVRNASGYLVEAMFQKKFHSESGIKGLFKNVNTKFMLDKFVKEEINQTTDEKKKIK